MLLQRSDIITIQAPHQGLHPVTDKVSGWLSSQAIATVMRHPLLGPTPPPQRQRACDAKRAPFALLLI